MSRYERALPAQTAAGADSTTTLGPVDVTDDAGTTITRALLVAPAGYATVTGAASNNVTFTVRQLRAGSVVTASVAALTTTVGVNLVAETPVVVPLTNNANLQQDDLFDVVMHQNASGVAVGAGLVAVVEVN